MKLKATYFVYQKKVSSRLGEHTLYVVLPSPLDSILDRYTGHVPEYRSSNMHIETARAKIKTLEELGHKVIQDRLPFFSLASSAWFVKLLRKGGRLERRSRYPLGLLEDVSEQIRTDIRNNPRSYRNSDYPPKELFEQEFRHLRDHLRP